MKIALLSENYTPDIGGLAISAKRVARLLVSAGHNVRVFAPTLNLPASDELARKSKALVSGLEVTVIPNGIDIVQFKPLPRNNALAESLNLMSEGNSRGTSRVIGFVGELREKEDCVRFSFSVPTRRSISRTHLRY